MNNLQQGRVLKDLGAGLILRRSTPEDAKALADFNARVHSDEGPEAPDERIAAWTRDLLTRPHPTFSPNDFTIVEQDPGGRIVSSLNLIPQTWAYEGIPFGVGRPELAGTLPEFRNRGLMRAQFDEIHRWSTERGHLVQAITGIPYFYRQFGYEMAMDLDGERVGYEAHVPKLKEGESEPFRIRPATEADIPFLARVYEHTQTRYPIVCQRTPQIWLYELNGKSEKNANRLEGRIIENERGKPVGYLMHLHFLVMNGLFAFAYELKAGLSWLAVTPSVVRYLWETGKSFAERDKGSCGSFGFILGTHHPVYTALGSRLPSMSMPYAWYLRVPDLTGFIRHIAPALEKRLEGSIAVGHTGKIRINRYSHMLVLSFERGKLSGVDEEARNPTDFGDLALPGLTILQLVFGRASFDEVHAAFPDAYVDNDEARLLLNILFPKKPSNLLGID
jgi:hypothetical protein